MLGHSVLTAFSVSKVIVIACPYICLSISLRCGGIFSLAVDADAYRASSTFCLAIQFCFFYASILSVGTARLPSFPLPDFVHCQSGWLDCARAQANPPPPLPNTKLSEQSVLSFFYYTSIRSFSLWRTFSGCFFDIGSAFLVQYYD